MEAHLTSTKEDSYYDKEIIVCAAIKVYLPDELIITGVRHGDCFKLLEDICKLSNKIDCYKIRLDDQGFITNYGRYVDREEAMKIAKENNQIKNKISLGNKLISEDLY